MDFYEMQPGDRVSFVGPQWSPGPHFRRDHWTYPRKPHEPGVRSTARASAWGRGCFPLQRHGCRVVWRSF